MRKQVWQYQCEHCGMKSTAAWWVKKHEMGCTKNPKRECGVCRKLLEQAQPKIEDLIALLPAEDIRLIEVRLQDPEAFDCDMIYLEMALTLSAALASLKEASGGCPACMLAAMRQDSRDCGSASWVSLFTGSLGGADHNFNFKEIMAECRERYREGNHLGGAM